MSTLECVHLLPYTPTNAILVLVATVLLAAWLAVDTRRCRRSDSTKLKPGIKPMATRKDKTA